MKTKKVVIILFMVLFSLSFFLAQPPQEAIDACSGMSEGGSCSFAGGQGGGGYE